MADIERKEQEIPKYVKVREVMQLCEVSESRAYRIIIVGYLFNAFQFILI